MKSRFIINWDEMMDKLILLSWVSGSGKTTLLTALLQAHSQLILVPSYTTRPMRPDEKNGRKYWHVSEVDFKNAIDAWEFLEYAIVHKKNYYGTRLDDVKKAFSKWLIPITEVDMHWLEKIKKDNKWIDYVSIFLDISDEKMVERIKKRWHVDQEEIDRRVASAHFERTKIKDNCDYTLVTDDTLKNNIKNLNQLVKKILNG